jgi:serine/threonine protein kinase
VFPEEVKVEQDIKNLIKKMLAIDPEKRIRWDDIFVEKLVEYQTILKSDLLSTTSTFCSETDKFVEKEKNKLNDEKITE